MQAKPTAHDPFHNPPLDRALLRWLPCHTQIAARGACAKIMTMKVTPDQWTQHFRKAYDETLAAVRSGARSAAEAVPSAHVPFLASIGCTAQELFDFADDAVKYGEPDYETALLISAVRRDYFLQVQRGVSSGKTVPMDSLPAKNARLDGIEWLPRLIEKARIKLRGEMEPDLMFGCSGDRKFFRNHGIHPADFLRMTWATDGNPGRMVEYVKAAAKSDPGASPT